MRKRLSARRAFFLPEERRGSHKEHGGREEHEGEEGVFVRGLSMSFMIR